MRTIFQFALFGLLLTACGGGGSTAEAPRPPAAPRELTAKKATDALAIDLTWRALAAARSYRVYRRGESFRLDAATHRMGGARGPGAGLSAFRLLASAPGVRETGEAHFRDVEVEAGVLYFYRVTAVGAGGESGASNIAYAAATPPDNRAPAPTAASILTTKNVQASTVVKAGDPNPRDTVHFALSTPPAHGKAAVSSAGLAVYQPATGFSGGDHFSVTVTDEWGLSGTVVVPVTVTNRTPALGAADLETYKNTPAGLLLDTGDPDAGEVFAFGVTEAPSHGSVAIEASGLLTYTPAADYVGADGFAVAVTDSSGASSGAVYTVMVSNRPPRPVVPLLMTELDTPGVTTILTQDPDPGETWTFEAVTGPSHGTAVISSAGVVDYVPDSGYVGPDNLEVKVTDFTGAAAFVFVPIVIDQTHLAAGMSLPIAAELCGDAFTRVLVTGINPPAYAAFVSGADVAFTVTLSYTTPVTQSIGATLGAYGSAFTTVEPGCGTVTIGGMAYAVSGAFWVEPSPNFSQTAVQYSAGDTFATAAFTTVALDRATVIRAPTFEFDTRIAFDLFGDVEPWSSYVDLERVGGIAGYRAAFFTMAPQVQGMPMRLRGALGCGDTFATYQLQGQRASAEATWGYAYLAFAAVPPAIRVDNFLTGLPVTTTAATQYVNLRACAGASAVTFTTSAPWFSADTTLTTLSAFADTPVGITVDGALIVPFGAPVTGTLRIWPFAGETFAPIDISVSAVKFAYDLPSYTRVGLTGSDDGAALIDLPWAFPAGGTTYTHVEVTANGTVNLADSACMSDWNNILGPFYPGAAGFYGCPVLAPLWADEAFLHTYLAGESVPDVYVRSVAGGDPYFEVLYWDLQSRGRFYSHSVILVRLYPDGRFEYEYPLLGAYGHESVGWWDAEGQSGPLTPAGALKSGDVLSFSKF